MSFTFYRTPSILLLITLMAGNKLFKFIQVKTLCLLIPFVFMALTHQAQTPVPMASQLGLTFTENFNAISTWTNGFASGSGAERWAPSVLNTNGSIPDGIRITTSSTTFVTGTTGGVQKGSSEPLPTTSIDLLSTGATSNTSSVAIDFFMDFTGVDAGTVSFNAATVFNSTGNRVGTLKLFWSVNGINFTELTGTNLPYIATNNVTGNASISNINLPTAFNNNANARLRFYYYNGTASGTTGSRPKIAIDDLVITANSSLPQPIVTSNSATATVNQFFTYTITASNSPTTYGASNLPAGLSLNNLSGVISGIPQNSQAASTINLTATNASGSGSGTLTLSIAQGSQSIIFPNIGTKTFGDAAFALNASGGNSGLPITYASSNTNIASISGNMVTIIGAGVTNITASQDGNANYLAAQDQTQTLTIAQAVQVIQFNPIGTKLITDPTFSLNAMGGGSGNPISYLSSNPAVANISGNMVTILSAGTTTITASQAGNANYLAASDTSQVLLVEKLPQVITFAPLPQKTIGDPSFNLVASGGNSGNPILFSSSNPLVASIVGNTVSILAPGTSIITATQSGNATYQAAVAVSQSLVVNSTSSSATYNFGLSATPTANATSGIPIANLTLSPVSSGNSAIAGQTALQLNSSSVSNYSGASGQVNAGIVARKANFHPDSSAYFEVSLTPSSGYLVTLNSMSFGTRSTSTGPTTLDIRTSLNNFATSVALINVLNNSQWVMLNQTLSGISYQGTMTIRIYGYETNTTGSVSAINWRIDDLSLQVSLAPAVPCTLSLSATASAILCNGGLSTVTANASGGNGTINYKLNGGVSQLSPIFQNLIANAYTVAATDVYGCSATTLITITQPIAPLVTAADINACSGIAATLIGTPSGGVFSIPNPYLGSTTKYIYTFTDSNACTYVSDSALVSVSNCSILNLKLFLEGYYIGGGTMQPALFNQGVSIDNTIVDDLVIELHHVGTYALVASATTQLHTDGLCSVSFPSLSGTYYIVVKHRNTIQTWSAAPVPFSTVPTFYDFSVLDTKAFGNNMKLVAPNTWAMYSGDINLDENIDLADFSLLEVDINEFNFGYVSTDVNGDGNIDLFDVPFIEGNMANFTFSNHPSYVVFPENMETGSKTNYTVADVQLGTGLWNFEDALLGNLSTDRKNGAQSARMQNLGKLTMKFSVPIDSSLITIWHAKFGTDANSTWALYVSTDAGLNWTQQGTIISTISTTLTSATFVVNYVGDIRLQVRKLSGGKLNIDDINISENTGIVVGPDNDHLTFGNPSGAVTDVSFTNNYLLIKPQFDLAYDDSRGTATWVAWHLDLTDMGTTPRCDCFATDVQLPSSFFRANASSYSGSGFDRGHMVPSSQRNNNITNNAVTFLMSNMMPQSPNLNQITWNNLEQYCVTLANNGYELYTYSGGYGMGGTGSNGGVTNTISSGNITVPSTFWKIVLALPIGSNDINRVTSSTRVIAVSMPNNQTVQTLPWGSYRTSVDAIETATGYDFFSNLPAGIQNNLEAIIDNGPTN